MNPYLEGNPQLSQHALDENLVPPARLTGHEHLLATVRVPEANNYPVWDFSGLRELNLFLTGSQYTEHQN